MGVIRGATGAVDGVANTDKWEIKTVAEAKPLVVSGGQYGTIRAGGMKDWQGNYRALGHTPYKFPGESLTFTGSIDGATGVTGACLAGKFSLLWHQETNAYFQHVLDFFGNGTLTVGAAVASDSTVPQPLTADENCIIKIDDVDQGDVRFAQLDITSDMKPYGSAKTAGYKKRIKGPIDFELAYGTYIATTAGLPALNSVVAVKMYVTVSTYWELTYAKIEEVEVLWECPDYVAAVVTARMMEESAGVMGTIKTPAGATKWPV